MTAKGGEKLSRLITQHLTEKQLPERAEKLAGLLADNDLNVTRTAEACGAQPRAVRRWVKVASDRGTDVLEMAREKLRERGIDPETLPAERVRDGMEEAREKVSDRSDTFSKRGRGRPKKTTGPV